jgi:hypothetical protein
MQCPEDQKSNYKLYRDFLTLLSPKAMAIGDANYKRIKPSSAIYSIVHSMKNFLIMSPELTKTVRKILKHFRQRKDIKPEIAFIQSSALKSTLLDYLEQFGTLEKIQWDILFTLFSVLDIHGDEYPHFDIE